MDLTRAEAAPASLGVAARPSDVTVEVEPTPGTIHLSHSIATWNST
jgi:hypothetical protein